MNPDPNATSTHPRRPSHRALVASTLCGAALGITTSAAADAHPLSLLAVLATPLLWLTLAALCLTLALLRRPRALTTTALTGCALLLPLHLPLFAPASPPGSSHLELFFEPCAEHLLTPPPRLRLITWNAHGLDLDDLDDIAHHLRDADILILQETMGQTVAQALADTLDGDALQIGHGWQTERHVARGTPNGFGPAIVSVGAPLATCNDARGHMLVLPGIGQRTTRGLVAVAHGTPVFDVHQDRIRRLDELPLWPDMLEQSAQRIAAVASAAGPFVVVAGDTNTAERFHRYHNTLRAAGLDDATAHVSWPARLGSQPFLPLWALDRVYVGRGWHIDTVDTLRIGRSDHLAVRVVLVRNDAD